MSTGKDEGKEKLEKHKQGTLEEEGNRREAEANEGNERNNKEREVDKGKKWVNKMKDPLRLELCL